MTDPLDRLAKRDPTRALPDPEPDMALLERLVATRPAPQPHTRRALLGATAMIAAAVAIAAVAGLRSTGNSSMDLAAKAYAEAAPNSGVVTHSLSVSDQTVRSKHPRPGKQSVWHTTTRQDRWLYRDRSHTILNHDGETYDQVLGADGVLRNRLPSGEVQTMHADKSGEGSEIVGSARTDPVAVFRQEFARGHLQDAGPVTFAGHAARAYQRKTAITLSRGLGRQVTTETFYLAVPAGVPLGMRVLIDNATTTVDDTTTLTLLEHLPANAANLAHVAG